MAQNGTRIMETRMAAVFTLIILTPIVVPCFLLGMFLERRRRRRRQKKAQQEGTS